MVVRYACHPCQGWVMMGWLVHGQCLHASDAGGGAVATPGASGAVACISWSVPARTCERPKIGLYFPIMG